MTGLAGFDKQTAVLLLGSSKERRKYLLQGFLYGVAWGAGLAFCIGLLLFLRAGTLLHWESVRQLFSAALLFAFIGGMTSWTYASDSVGKLLATRDSAEEFRRFEKE